MINITCLPRRKLHLSQEKNLSRKTLDFQDHNDVNDSVKSQYNFNNSICSVHQAVKKYIHSTISLFTHQCIPFVLYNIRCRMFLRRGIFLHLEIYTITCLLFLKNGNVPALSSFLLRESSFNMTRRGGGGMKIFRGGSENF